MVSSSSCIVRDTFLAENPYFVYLSCCNDLMMHFNYVLPDSVVHGGSTRPRVTRNKE